MKDVLYTDWSMEFADPIECEGCEAITNYGEECTCEPAVVLQIVRELPPLDEEDF